MERLSLVVYPDTLGAIVPTAGKTVLGMLIRSMKERASQFSI